MDVEHLFLKNFRIHKEFSFNCNDHNYQFILLQGPNGIGKTSILEALSFLNPGKGLKNIGFEDAIKNDEECWTIFATLKSQSDTTSVGMSCNNNGRRVIKINNKFVRSSIGLLNVIKIIWLTPAEDALLAESKSLRRKFLDRLTYNFDIDHASSINKYDYQLRSRLRLLKDGNYDEIWLQQIEKSLAELSFYISRSRLLSIDRLNKELQNANKGLLIPALELNCKIASNINDLGPNDIQHEFFKSRSLDARVGQSLYGIHRADFTIVNTAKSVNANKSSTGELKGMLINIILAQIRSLNKIDNIKPLFLLDDILSHFDSNKVHEILSELQQIDAQVWISGVNFDMLDPTIFCKNFIKISI